MVPKEVAAIWGDLATMTTAQKSVIRARVPDAWAWKESITLLAPDGRANVIASSEPLDPTIDAAQYAEVQGELLRTEFDEYEEVDFGPRLIFGGRAGYSRTFLWTPDKADRIAQLQLYYAENGRGYTATATTPAADFERYERQLRECLDDLVLAVDPPGTTRLNGVAG